MAGSVAVPLAEESFTQGDSTDSGGLDFGSRQGDESQGDELLNVDFEGKFAVVSMIKPKLIQKLLKVHRLAGAQHQKLNQVHSECFKITQISPSFSRQPCLNTT